MWLDHTKPSSMFNFNAINIYEILMNCKDVLNARNAVANKPTHLLLLCSLVSNRNIQLHI
jgi:hypothetical protein